MTVLPAGALPQTTVAPSRGQGVILTGRAVTAQAIQTRRPTWFVGGSLPCLASEFTSLKETLPAYPWSSVMTLFDELRKVVRP